MSFCLVRSKGPIIGDGLLLSRKHLRNAIPAGPLLDIMIDAALTGNVKKLDSATGEEIGAATPLSTEAQLKLVQWLLERRLPAMKAPDASTDEETVVDLREVPTTPEDIKRLPLSQLGRVIEAQFRVNAENP